VNIVSVEPVVCVFSSASPVISQFKERKKFQWL